MWFHFRFLVNAALAMTVAAQVTESAAAQPGFAPGDRVYCDWLQNGRPDLGTVVPFASTDLDQSGRWYRVRLDKDTIANSTVECMFDRLRAAPGNAAADTPAAASTQAPVSPTPPPASAPAATDTRQQPPASQPGPAVSNQVPAQTGPLPPLPGTAWKIDYGRGKTGDVFLFCSTGTWQIVPAYGSIGAVGRSFDVSGTTLTTVNRDDGQVQAWRMSGSDGVMVIDDGQQRLTLHYNGTTQCR